MKKLTSLLALSALFFTACGSAITVADKETIKAYPELEGAMLTWQGMVEAVQANDCAAFLEGMRLTLQLDETVCEAAFDYFSDGVPEVDWARSDWSTSGGKVKIYKKDGGSITSFILNEADDSWRADDIFWE